MFAVQDAILILLGAVACFTGYSMFRSMLPLWGFILGGWIFMTFAPLVVHVATGQELLLRVVAFFVGGVIGAIIAIPLYFVIVFLSGAALGALTGIMLGALIDVGGITSFKSLSTFTAMTFPPQPNTPLQFLFMVILGVILGVMAINFQKFMVSSSSAFIGSAALVGGLSGTITSNLQVSGAGFLLLMIWLLVGFIGLFVQYRVMGDEV
jgi:hypothetical protein